MHAEKASKVVKDVDLSYLSSTALTLEDEEEERGEKREGRGRN